MSDGSNVLEKLAAVERAVQQMAELRQQVIELQNLENQHQKKIAALQMQEKNFRTFLAKIPQKVFIKDRNSAYIACNENYAADLKISPEEIEGKTDFDFFPQDMAEKYRSDDQRILQTGQFEEMEEKYVLDGKESLVRLMKTPIRGENGDISGIAALFFDITEQKGREEAWSQERQQTQELLLSRAAEIQKIGEELQRQTSGRQSAEEALKKVMENFGSVVESAHLGIQVIQDGSVKFSNPKCTEIFGVSQTELISKPLSEFIVPENRENFALQMERVKDCGPANSFACRVLQKDGTVKWVENRASATNWEGKTAVLNFLVDITKRKETEEELRSLLDSFRPLVNTMEKILSNLNRE